MNTLYDRFKKAVDDKIAAVKIPVLVAGGFNPVVMFATEESCTEKTVDLEEVDNNLIAQMLRSECENPAVKAAALILDSYTLLVDNKDLDKLPETIAKVKGRMESIVAFLYTPDKVIMRRLPYTKTDDNTFFADIGWEDTPVTSAGRFSNPFLPKTISLKE
jgi:hypothetical protein